MLIDPAGHGRLRAGGRIGLAALLFWAGQLLAYVFVFGFTPYYDVYAEQPTRLLGLSPLDDQKLAGVVMMIEQAATLGVALVLLVLAARRARTTASDGAGARPGLDAVPVVVHASSRCSSCWRSSPSRCTSGLAAVDPARRGVRGASARASRSSSWRSTRRSGRSRSSTSSSSTCSRT